MWCCADHDPALAVMFTCRRCGRVAYPTDACWITDTLVLVDHPAGCEHGRGGVDLVDVTTLAPVTAWCGAYAVSTGEPCRRRAGPDGGPCRLHRSGRRWARDA